MNISTRNKLKRIIMQEMAKMVGEDALISNTSKDDYRNTGYYPNARSPHNLSLTKTSASYDDFGGGSYCNACGGSNMYEGECMECGYSGGQMLEEGCGCGCPGCEEDSYGYEEGTDYSIDSMFKLGGNEMMRFELPEEFEIDYSSSSSKGHNNNYMAKKQLHTIADLAQKLNQMVPEGYELEDWQRSHLSSIADDIMELYFSLESEMHGR